jgi:single-stranded DNA-binding protein
LSIEAAFVGTLGRDAEGKVSKNGKPYLRLNARVGGGDAAQWVSILVFDGNVAESPEKFMKGARVYCEGTIKLEEWTGQDGAKRAGLSCFASLCRLSEIGSNKPKTQKPAKSADTAPRPVRANDFHSDEVPW